MDPNDSADRDLNHEMRTYFEIDGHAILPNFPLGRASSPHDVVVVDPENSPHGTI